MPSKGYCTYRLATGGRWVERVLFAILMAVLLMSLCTLDSKAQDQSQPPVPPDPSQLERQFEERRLPTSSFSIRRETEEAQELGAAADIRFVLHNLSVEGVTVFSGNELEPFYQNLIGTEISVAQLFDVAGRLSAFYRNEGYILSRVTVPAQEVENGVVRLTAVEGYIHNVSIQGEAGRLSPVLERLANKIAQSRPLKANVLERYMLLANDLPGVTASAVLQASEQPGATDLSLVVAREKASGYLSANNRGSRFNGPVQGQLVARANGVLGSASSTGVRVIGSAQISEFQLYEASHIQVLGSEGTTLELVGRFTQSNPGSTLADLDIESESLSGMMRLSHPVIRSRARSLVARAVFDVRHTETDILGEPLSEDRVRVVRVGATYDFIDRLDGINLLDVEVSHGLDILDATQTGSQRLSRADAETDFVKVSASATRLQRLGAKVSMLLDVAGQFTSDGLVASEEFAIGGSQFGRAFDPSEISGDRAAAGRIELRYDGLTNWEALKSYQVYVFGDYGVVWNQTNNGYQAADLGSAGAGIRLSLTDHVSAYAEVAVPFEKTADFDARFGSSVRGFAGISLRF